RSAPPRATCRPARVPFSARRRLRAAGVRPAVAARVARARADHPAAAAGALDGVLPGVEERRLARRRRVDWRRPGRRVAVAAVRVALRDSRLHLGREDPDLLLLLGRQELLAEPAEDV